MSLPLWYVVFLLSLTCHEASHAWVAYRGGDPTAYLGGQATLNPLPHIRREPVGTVLAPLLSFAYYHMMLGWASAPYDPLWERRHPRRAALMAAAGPLANLALAAAAFVALKVGLSAGIGVQPTAGVGGWDRLVVPAAEGALASAAAGRVLSILFFLNLLLFVLNLFPLPPMDGSSVLAGLASPARALMTRIRELPFGGLLGLAVVWIVFPYVFAPILTLAVLALWS